MSQFESIPDRSVFPGSPHDEGSTTTPCLAARSMATETQSAVRERFSTSALPIAPKATPDALPPILDRSGAIETRFCKKCRIEKPLLKSFRRRGTRGRRHCQCNACHAADQKVFREKERASRC